MTNIESLTLSHSEFNGGSKIKPRAKNSVASAKSPENCAPREQKDQTNPFWMDGWSMSSLHGEFHGEGDTCEFWKMKAFIWWRIGRKAAQMQKAVYTRLRAVRVVMDQTFVSPSQKFICWDLVPRGRIFERRAVDHPWSWRWGPHEWN